MELYQYVENIFGFNGTPILESHFAKGLECKSDNFYLFLTSNDVKDGIIEINENTKFIQKRNIRKFYKPLEEHFLWHGDFIICIKDDYSSGIAFLFDTMETDYEVLVSKDFLVLRPSVPYLKQLLSNKQGREYFSDAVINIIKRYNSNDTLIFEKIQKIPVPINFFNSTIEKAKEKGSSTWNKNIDLSSIRMAQKPLSIDKILKRIEHNEINLLTKFQRKTGLWEDGVKSRLVETIMLNMPIPAFYFDATDESKWLIVDGLQRLSALKEFIIDKTLVLKELDYLPELEGKTFDKLDRLYQRRIEEFDIIAYLIEPGTPKEVKYKIFKSINTSALVLVPQEIRHALNEGTPSEYLEELANMNEFVKMNFVNSKLKERMEDRELVLRYVAFRIYHYTEYRPSMKEFLDEAMNKIFNLHEEKLEEYKSIFSHSIFTLSKIFKNDVFTRSMYLVTPDKSYPLNSSLFEIWMNGVADISFEERKKLIEKARIVKQQFVQLFESNKEFQKSLDNESANTIESVLKRFSEIEKLIKSILSDDDTEPKYKKFQVHKR